MELRLFRFVGIVLGVIILGCKEHSPMQAKTIRKPNIIYVLADDLGYGDLSVYNPEGKIKTPHLDQLAQEGMRFTDAHSSSSVCTPTRYGILTGRYNWRSPLKEWTVSGTSRALIPSSRTTLASLLKKQGYVTAFIGKWHLGWDWALQPNTQIDTIKPGLWEVPQEAIDFSQQLSNSPRDLGFDRYFGHSGSLDMPPYVYVANDFATAIPKESTVNKGKFSWWREGLTASDFEHEKVTPRFFEEAMVYVKEKAKEDQPFFLYLPLPSPHTPILPGAAWQGKSGLNAYGDFVLMVDHYMGQLNQLLKESGIAEQTLVVFTSDNGCSPAADYKGMLEKGHRPNGEFRGHKADIYEGGHRVPLLIKWPGQIKANTVSEVTVNLNDFFATAASITDYSLQANEGEDSFDMLPIFKDQPHEYKREASVHHSGHGYFAIRKGPWKLALCPGSGGWSYPTPGHEALDSLPPMQLFHLKNDPAESENLLEKHPAKAQELEKLLKHYIAQGRSTPGTPQANDGPTHWKQLDW